MSEAFLDWDPAQVAQHFLAEIGEDMTSSFIDNNIDGSLLPFLTTGHLRELGIELLSSRLRLKKKINELLASQHAEGVPKVLESGNLHLKSVDINSNYILMEALSLCLVLLNDLSKSSQRVSDDFLDIKQLNENFKRLKMDLNPVIRLVKDSKPLPTPTLDPGANISLPTQSDHSILSTHSWLASDSESGQTPTTATTLVLPGPSPNKLSFSPQYHSVTSGNIPSPGGSLSGASIQTSSNSNSAKLGLSSSSTSRKFVSSPTQSNRFSSGSVLSVGVGKIADLKTGVAARFPSKARLVDTKSSASSIDDIPEGTGHKSNIQQVSMSGSRPMALKSKSSSALMTSNASTQPSQTNQPLKQLKASSEDTCLKVLQHAMKRHHIPREKWSKYVLVVCYGDKERILKLTEKPVIIFKELQEHGQNPTIMLRERASTSENEHEYEDSRIGDDIPGGTL